MSGTGAGASSAPATTGAVAGKGKGKRPLAFFKPAGGAEKRTSLERSNAPAAAILGEDTTPVDQRGKEQSEASNQQSGHVDVPAPVGQTCPHTPPLHVRWVWSRVV